MTFNKHGRTGSNIYILMLTVAMVLPVTRSFSDLGALTGLGLIACLAIGAWINARAIIKGGSSGKGEFLGLLSGLLAWLTCWGAYKTWTLVDGDPSNADVVCIVSVVAASFLAALACRRMARHLEPPDDRT